MDHLDFGPGFGIMIVAIVFLQLVIRTLIALIILHYLAKLLVPTTARLLGYGKNLNRHSRSYFFGWLITWLFIAPIISGVFEIFSQQLIMFSPFGNYFGSFIYFNFYLLGLTLWTYDSTFEKFKLVPFGKIIVRGVVFVVLVFVLNTLSMMFTRGAYSIPGMYLFTYVIYPAAFGLLTVYYVRKNKREEINIV